MPRRSNTISGKAYGLGGAKKISVLTKNKNIKKFCEQTTELPRQHTPVYTESMEEEGGECELRTFSISVQYAEEMTGKTSVYRAAEYAL